MKQFAYFGWVMMSSELSQHFQTSEVMWFVYQWHHNFTGQHVKQRHDVIFQWISLRQGNPTISLLIEHVLLKRVSFFRNEASPSPISTVRYAYQSTSLSRIQCTGKDLARVWMIKSLVQKGTWCMGFVCARHLSFYDFWKNYLCIMFLTLHAYS